MNSFTFLLPVKIDNADRMNNLHASLKYLNKFFPECETILVESDNIKKCESLQNQYRFTYYFLENMDNFSKSKAINFGLVNSNRPYFVVWDIDCLILPEKLKITERMLSSRKAHVVLPHNEIFVNIKNSLKEEVAETLNLGLVPQFKKVPKKSSNKNIEVYPIPSGVVAFNRDSLLRIGGYNKMMVSYGWEDIEILKRAKRLGMYYFSLTSGNIIHLDHSRGTDSKVNNYYETNKKEFEKVISMPKKQLIDYVNNDLSLDSSKYQFTESFRNEIKASNARQFNNLRFLTNRIYTKLHAHPPF